MNGYEVTDIEEAVYMARIIFGITPSTECLAEAKATQDYWVKKAITELATEAGLGNTRRA